MPDDIACLTRVKCQKWLQLQSSVFLGHDGQHKEGRAGVARVTTVPSCLVVASQHAVQHSSVCLLKAGSEQERSIERGGGKVTKQCLLNTVQAASGDI